MSEYLITKEDQTKKLARELAKQLKGGEIIALEGDLGAGKTTFTQYLAKSFGIKQNVTSPTFVLMKIYKVESRKFKVKSLVHVDCYRLDDAQELFYLGIEEYLNKPDSIVVIEWADKIKQYLKSFKHLIWLKIDLRNEIRTITVKKTK
jgi:tRNA threonylcarbamoyladenosine biosynthesis protein TsaE